jgi:hypothetical protein
MKLNVSCDITITCTFLSVLKFTDWYRKHTNRLNEDSSDRGKGVGSLNSVHKECKCCVFFLCVNMILGKNESKGALKWCVLLNCKTEF